MNKIMETDVAIIGAGISGLVTALRLSEQGLRTLVLEKGEDEKYPCNTRIAGGAFHIAHRDVEESPEVIREAIMNRTLGTARPELVEAMANDMGAATAWLKKKGVRFIKVGHEIYRKHTLSPPISPGVRKYWEGRAGDVLLRTLAAELAKGGGTLLRGTRAVRLVMSDCECVGVEAEQKAGPVQITAKSVVICDGGFQANAEMLREFITDQPDKVRQRNSGSGNGDGLRMAREVGAQFVGMNRFYGHVLCQDAMHNDDLWPFPIMDFLCTAGIVVDGSARRFMDEGLGGVRITNALAALPDPLSATVIFDREIWNGPGREYLPPTNPTLLSNGGTVYAAPDLKSLASQLGLPGESLEEAVAQYNAAVDSEQTHALTPTRSTGKHKPHPIRNAPFHAVKLCAGLTYTMGGLAIDGAARVLDKADKPIPGLYAAGCATGGLEGGEHIAYLGGLSRSTVTALLAANDIAARLQHA